MATDTATTIRPKDPCDNVVGNVLGGGPGINLYPLTKSRAEPALPLGGNHLLVDIPLSNCLNSGIEKNYVITQYNSSSLSRHISCEYNSHLRLPSEKKLVESLVSTQSMESSEWFKGTVDAVRRHQDMLEESVNKGVDNFLILSGEHVYRMDYKELVDQHRKRNSDITVAAIPCEREQASEFGIMKLDGQQRNLQFSEKPDHDTLEAMLTDLTMFGLDPIRSSNLPCTASMGIYFIKAEVVMKLLFKDLPTANDFGKDIIPVAIETGMKVHPHMFGGYWEHVGSVGAFLKANLETVQSNPRFRFDHEKMPIHSNQTYLPSSNILGAEIDEAVIRDGSFICGGTRIQHSVLGRRTMIGAGCFIQDSLIRGADCYETLEECTCTPGLLPMGVGHGCVIRNAIVDKNTRIGAKSMLINKEGVKEASKQ